jgi:hypothetical protein
MNSPLYNFYISPNNNNILSDLIMFLNNSSSQYEFYTYLRIFFPNYILCNKAV